MLYMHMGNGNERKCELNISTKNMKKGKWETPGAECYVESIKMKCIFKDGFKTG